jgi:16S rRNA (guanine1207-N2)-methyltransferase
MSRKKSKRVEQERPVGPRVRPQEQLLIDIVPELPTGRLLCNTVGRGQFARAYAAGHPTGHVTAWFLDVYLRDRAASPPEQVRAYDKQAWHGSADRWSSDDEDFSDDDLAEFEDDFIEDSLDTDEALDAEDARNPEEQVEPLPLDETESVEAPIDFVCTADPPEEPFDVVAWAFRTHGESEMVREMLQTAYLRLAPGGRFAAAIDNPEDQWLHGELKKLYPKVTRRPSKRGVTYLTTRPDAPIKIKQHAAEFAFRDRGRLISAISRPGVFSHRQIDPGARALINTMELPPHAKVLDLGCGSGTVALAALCRSEGIRVLGIDSNPRALQCAERGAAANGLTGLTTALDATGAAVPAGTFDVVLANPPYFSQYRIAELFLRTAAKALRVGGEALVVTKAPKWFLEAMPQVFAEVETLEVKDYYVLVGVRDKRYL